MSRSKMKLKRHLSELSTNQIIMENTADFKASVSDRLMEMSAYVSTEENAPQLSFETLMDAFLAIHTDCKAITNKNEQISGFVAKCNALLITR